MKKVIVSYSSIYGHTKKYAEYIAEKLNCPIVKFEGTRIKDYNDYDIIIYPRVPRILPPLRWGDELAPFFSCISF